MIAALRVCVLLLLGIDLASAEPIKASEDMIRPTNPPKPANATPSSGSADQLRALVEGQAKVLKIEKVEVKEEDGGTMLTASVSHSSAEPVAPANVKILCYFYEKAKDGSLKLSSEKTTSQWTTPPIDWANKGTEIVTLHNPVNPNKELTYAGAVVGVYYRNELQDFWSAPEALAGQFPLQATLRSSSPSFDRIPSIIFIESYKLLQQADQAVKEQDAARAKALLESVTSNLAKLKEHHPDWEPLAVDHLLGSVKERMDGLK